MKDIAKNDEELVRFKPKIMVREATGKLKEMLEESKECMYSTANYTNGERLELCKDCKEICRYNQKTAAESLGISQEAYDEIVDKCLYGSEVELVDDVDLPKEEAVSDFTKALAECIHQAQCAAVDPMAHAEIWKGELLELAKGKEPMSEDLEKAAKECAFNLQLQEYFKKGAQWKEKQMKEKCNKFIQISFDNGVETGRNEMKRDAKEAHVIMTHVTKDSVVPSLSAVTLDDSYKEGDKVKVLILKE